mmetsp:Transcript_93598/g.195128  ORF Transcript_93598/g.195128 Transcript_93598/m.195128 type:complete len:217 (+) Transcript_93598:457-1107(+)
MNGPIGGTFTAFFHRNFIEVFGLGLPLSQPRRSRRRGCEGPTRYGREPVAVLFGLRRLFRRSARVARNAVLRVASLVALFEALASFDGFLPKVVKTVHEDDGPNKANIEGDHIVSIKGAKGSETTLEQWENVDDRDSHQEPGGEALCGGLQFSRWTEETHRDRPKRHSQRGHAGVDQRADDDGSGAIAVGTVAEAFGRSLVQEAVVEVAAFCTKWQ